MPDIKMSEMTAATKFTGTDIAGIVQGGSNKKITATALFANIEDPVVINSASENNDTIIKGQTDANLFVVDASTDRIGIGIAAPTEKLHVVGTSLVDGLQKNISRETVTATGTLNLTKSTTIVDSASSVTLTLAAGSEGLFKTVYRKGAGAVVINTATLVVGASSTITFTAVGSSVTLQYLGSSWYIYAVNNCTFA